MEADVDRGLVPFARVELAEVLVLRDQRRSGERVDVHPEARELSPQAHLDLAESGSAKTVWQCGSVAHEARVEDLLELLFGSWGLGPGAWSLESGKKMGPCAGCLVCFRCLEPEPEV